MERQRGSSNSHTARHAIKSRCLTKHVNSNQYCTCCFHLSKHGNRKSRYTQQGEAESLILWYIYLGEECSIFLWVLSALKSSQHWLFVCRPQTGTSLLWCTLHNTFVRVGKKQASHDINRPKVRNIQWRHSTTEDTRYILSVSTILAWSYLPRLTGLLASMPVPVAERSMP